jgi:vacuolar-type H+-ATPase subunit I/STV1
LSRVLSCENGHESTVLECLHELEQDKAMLPGALDVVHVQLADQNAEVARLRADQLNVRMCAEALEESEREVERLRQKYDTIKGRLSAEVERLRVESHEWERRFWAEKEAYRSLIKKGLE